MGTGLCRPVPTAHTPYSPFCTLQVHAPCGTRSFVAGFKPATPRRRSKQGSLPLVPWLQAYMINA